MGWGQLLGHCTVPLAKAAHRKAGAPSFAARCWVPDPVPAAWHTLSKSLPLVLTGRWVRGRRQTDSDCQLQKGLGLKMGP